MRPNRLGVGLAAVMLVGLASSPALAAPPAGPSTLDVAAPAADGGLTVGLTSGSRVHVQTVRGHAAPARSAATAAVPTGNGINYHGGPVVAAEKVQAIYWAAGTVYNGGPAAGTSGTGAQDASIVGYFLGNLAGSPYYNINTTYSDNAGRTVANTLAYTGFWADTAGAPASGANVSDASVQAEIVKGLSGGQLAYDASTVYAVFSAQGVNLGGGAFTQYCAYHGYFTWNGQPVLYAVMPYDYTKPSACSALSGSPNADAAADAEVSVLAHELEEANTDPLLNAWYDGSGNENADKCAWNFGTTFTSNGAQANIMVGTKAFLVQQNWLNANGGSCVQGWSTAPATSPGQPTGVGAASTPGSITVTWSPPSSNGGASITGYSVYKATASGAETLLTTVGNVTSYVDTAVSQATTYYYEVAATNSAGTGLPSTEASGVPGVPPVNTGWQFATAAAAVTTSAGDNNGYETGSANLFAFDGAVATDASSGTGSSQSCTSSSRDKENLSGFAFGLPGAAAVKGIEVQLRGRVSSTSSSPRFCVQLSWNGGTTWTTGKLTSTLTTTLTTYTLGTTADTWGRTWAAADFGSSFRVRVIDLANSTSRTFTLDGLSVRLTY